MTLGAEFITKIVNDSVALLKFVKFGKCQSLWYGTILWVIPNFCIIVVQVGSVDEESTKSDEEYDDLAMQDVVENGYWSDDDEEFRSKFGTGLGDLGTKMHGNNKYRQNLDLFLRTRSSDPVPEPLCSYSSLLMEMEKGERRLPPSGKAKLRKRSLSISALGKGSSAIQDPILSGAPQR